jgi:signal transduction histidine kinase
LFAKQLLISDNGSGFDIESAKYGFGMKNISKRAKIANVILKISSIPSVGTTLRIN